MLDKPMSKKQGPRFHRPDRQSMDFYSNGRLTHTRIMVRDTGGFDEQSADIIARRIIAWNNGTGPDRNAVLIDKQRAKEKADGLAKDETQE